MNGLRRATLLFCGIAILIVVGSLVGAVYFAPPHGQNQISGITITGATPSALLPRHGLACATGPTTPLITVCRAMIGATPLVLTATRDVPNSWSLSACTATYGERTTFCRATFPPYTIVNGDQLGIAAADLAALRPAWSPERWDTAMWRRAYFGLAALVALAIAAAALNVPLSHPLGRVTLALGTGFTAFILAAPLLGVFLNSLGYID